MVNINRNNKGDALSSVYNGLTNIIYNSALDIRQSTDNFINDFLSVKITDFITFNEKNYIYMKRLMNLNIFEKDITLNALANINTGERNDASYKGDSSSYSSLVKTPSYAKDIDYISNYVQEAKSGELNGMLSTNVTIDSGVYREKENLYPDDLGTGNGEFTNKWDVNNNTNSILSKTKKLFNNRNINSLISRFGTGADEKENIRYNGSSSTRYGESRGRNLLTKSAEENGEVYEVNGYKNPYCRVWTHHHKYDRISRLIRPFTYTDDMGNSILTSVNDFHTWGTKFKSLVSDNKNGGNWKDGNRGWENSVLSKNGILNITPKYNEVTGNIHTKDCMFSIENLAWKDYDPYSFENALSWEQRGPNGGRIMWFPPYGITFSESTNANWSSNTFIGRGEDVYTYVNTKRSGSLSFLMVVDHPSVIDYALWDKDKKNNKDISETDLLRFFAGCDSGDSNDSNSLLSKVSPTPLTDEFIDDNEEIIPINNNENIEDKYEDTDDDLIEVSFMTFFPNNYSGVYDYPSNKDSNVNAIAYLLFGNGCQKNNEEDIVINFNNILDVNGYEIKKPISNKVKQDSSNNIIIGSLKKFKNGETNKQYFKDNNKIWYYRIDGKYETPTTNNELLINTYDQIFINKNNYIDENCFGLNLDEKIVKKYFNYSGSIYSFVDVAAAFLKMTSYNKAYDKLRNISLNKDNIDKLYNIFENYELKESEIYGYASVHGYSEKNIALAKNRANTIKKWLTTNKWKNIINNTNIEIDNTEHKKVGEYSSGVSDVDIKSDRSVIVKLFFKKSGKKTLSEARSNNKNEIHEYLGFNIIDKEKNLYKDKNGIIWMKTKDDYGNPIFKRYDSIENYFGNKIDKEGQNSNSDKNKYRYDQEYYFFKQLEKDNPIIYKSLLDKLKYFDPAFHSMTPEGFNGRLTFLQQCMRQGNTKTMSDINGNTANNLAFGRPPFCILRLGDFYNQMIVIESLNIDYNVSSGIMWDLNIEGAGVQPILANVTLNFNFIGGGDLTGPIKRLQNAMSFNYYANTRLYDNRADRNEYSTDKFGNRKRSNDSYIYNTSLNKKKNE